MVSTSEWGLTPNTSTANNQNNNNVSPGSLPPGDAFMHNNGLYFPSISQFDADQYSDFKLPGYDSDDSEGEIYEHGPAPAHVACEHPAEEQPEGAGAAGARTEDCECLGPLLGFSKRRRQER